MPDDQELSPEEKLLKVIQEGDDETAATAEGEDVSPAASAPKAAPAGRSAQTEAATGPAKAEVASAKSAKPAGKTAEAKPKLGVKKKAAKKTGTEEGAKSGASAASEKKAAGKKSKKEDVPEAADEATPAPAAGPGGGGQVRTRGGVFKTVNTALVASAMLLTGGIVWEIFAAKDTMPEQPAAEGLAEAASASVPLESEKVIVELFNIRDPWEWVQKNTNAESGPVESGGFGEVAHYIKQNMVLDGVSYSADRPGESTAAITDRRRGETYFLGVGHPVPILGLIPSTEPTKLTLGKVRDKGVSLSYDDQGSIRDIHIQLQ